MSAIYWLSLDCWGLRQAGVGISAVPYQEIPTLIESGLIAHIFLFPKRNQGFEFLCGVTLNIEVLIILQEENLKCILFINDKTIAADIQNTCIKLAGH